MILEKIKKNYWPRAIILIDMNAFFASIEQQDNPQLRGKPIAVTNGETGTCIITCSYEARWFGVHTGMRIKEAKSLCPTLIKVSSRPRRYVEISSSIMTALEKVTPDIEIFSIDEAFLDVTNCQKIYSSPIEAARLAQKIVREVSNLPCSIGLSGDKTTAKYAAESIKPNGFTVILPWEAEKTLAQIPVRELCGIGSGMEKFLARQGIIKCGDMSKVPISIMAKRFGNLGRRIWWMCHGQDPEPVHVNVTPPKSIGHGKILPPLSDMKIVKTYFLHMVEKVAARLRQNKMFASKFFVGMRKEDWQWLELKYTTPSDTQHGDDIFLGCEKLLATYPHPGIIRQVQVTALNPHTSMRQLSLLENDNYDRQTALDAVIDDVNEKFGDYALMSSMLLHKSKTPNVISPAWRSKGARNYKI